MDAPDKSAAPKPPQFRVWKLLAFAAAYSLVFICIVALSGMPPSRQYLDELTYRHAWIATAVGGAITGSMAYLATLFLRARIQRPLRFSTTALTRVLTTRF